MTIPQPFSLDDYQKKIAENPLDEVIIYIHKIFLFDPKSLNGEMLARLAKRLINSEVEVGGPYVSKDDIYTNILIMRLFKLLGSPLVNLEKFLTGKQYIPENNHQKEALQLPIDVSNKEGIAKKITPNNTILKTQDRLKTLNINVAKQACVFLEKIVRVDKNEEISNISLYTLKSLTGSPSKEDLDLCELLGEANIYAWTAYTIYDDFIDGEGSADLLSLANILHRKSYAMYINLFPDKAQTITNYFDLVDTSNLWEINNCRAKIENENIIFDSLPEYNDGIFLAERAIGHILGPMLLVKNLKLGNKQENLIKKSLESYLIAKQINDDLTDWKKDLRNGHINFVISRLLKISNIKSGTYDISTLINKLRPIFWNKVYEECTEIALRNLNYALENIGRSEIFTGNNLLVLKVIKPLKADIQADIQRHYSEKKFLKIYTS